MKFIKLFRFDVKNGILKNKFLCLSALIIPVIFCVDFARLIPNSYHITSFADFLLYIYGGMKEYVPSPTEQFVFPVIWILLFVTLLYLTLGYPYKDMQSLGQQTLIRTKGRILWWLSKCSWNVLCTLLFHFAVFIIVYLFCMFTGRNTGLNIYMDFLNDYFHIDNVILSNMALPLAAFFMPVLISIAINLLQMTLSLFIKPIFSFLIIAIIMLASAYLLSPFMLGNYAMLVRSNMIIKNGVDLNIGVVISLILIALSVIIGMIRFKHYDLLNRND